MNEIVNDGVLPRAYEWVCERRRADSANDDVWDLRWRWDKIRPGLQVAIRAGTYRIGSTRRLRVEEGNRSQRSSGTATVLIEVKTRMKNHF